MENNSKIKQYPYDVSPSLFAEQIQLEVEMHEHGKSAYNKRIERHQKNGTEGDTHYGNTLIVKNIAKLSSALTNWRSELEVNPLRKTSRFHAAVEPLKSTSPEIAAAIALRLILGKITSLEYARQPEVASEIGRQLEDHVMLEGIRQKEKQLFDNIRTQIDKKTEYRKKRDSLNYVARYHGEDRPGWGTQAHFDIGVLLIELAATSTGLFVIERKEVFIKNQYKTVNCLVFAAKTIELIQKYKCALLDLCYMPMPMVIPPIPLEKGNLDNYGYITSHVPSLTAVKTRSTLQKRLLRSADMPVFIDGMNAAMNTPWRVRQRMLDFITSLPDTDLFRDVLPKRSPYKKPKKPVGVTRDSEEFISWRRTAKNIHKHNTELVSELAFFEMVLGTAKRYSKYEKIYFPYQADYRSRGYVVSLLSPQGADWNKALLEFGEAHPIGEYGQFWIMLTVANLFADCPWTGCKVDKKGMNDRVQWVTKNWQALMNIAQDPLQHTDWIHADKPFQALAALWELEGAAKHGSAWKSRLSVNFDGSCSGLQILGGAFRCEKTAAMVNLIPNDKPSDIYSHIAECVSNEISHMVEHYASREELIGYLHRKLQDKADDQTVDEYLSAKVENNNKTEYVNKQDRKHYGKMLAAWDWIKFGITRKYCKRSVMTYVYSSKEYGFREQIMEDTILPLLKEAAEKAFKRGYIESATDTKDFVGLDKKIKKELGFPFDGWGTDAAALLAKLIYKHVQETVAIPAEAMAWMEDTARLIAKYDIPLVWNTPAGFPIVQNYQINKNEILDLFVAGRRYQLSTKQQSRKTDSRKSASGISPNTTHGLDASLLWLTVVNGYSAGIRSFSLIHDSFGTHPHMAGNLFTVIRKSFIQLFSDKDIFGEYRKQLIQLLPTHARNEVKELPRKGNYNIRDVLQAKHAFC